MADIKLFRISSGVAVEISGQAAAIEKKLQLLIEKNLETILGVRFIASEYSTGKVHGGRIDTLGIDENNCPVIIEYKRSVNENVINQGLYYLDWLMDHKAEFELLVLKKFGQEMSSSIEWSSPRLLCVAGDFTKYDEHAVSQINRNIELLRYRIYSNDLLMLDLANAKTSDTTDSGEKQTGTTKYIYKTVSEYLEQSGQEIKTRYETLRDYILSLGDDIQVNTLKFYIAFKRIKNFACVEIRPNAGNILVYVKMNPNEVPMLPGFTRNVKDVGHFGTGDLEITIKSDEDLERAKPLILKSYEAS